MPPRGAKLRIEGEPVVGVCRQMGRFVAHEFRDG